MQFISQSQQQCCCGTPQELNFSGFDFEIDPLPPPAGYFPYVAVSPFGPWTVTQGAIDIGDPAYCGFLAGGNPNGASYFIDLFGSPPTGSVAGTLEYPLFGLTPGFTYTIEFWYATFTANGSFSANLKVANGAWLNANWTANNPGSAIWLKKTYSFVAKTNSAILSFTDTGSSSSTYQIGMLLDDIKIFECPTDSEMPVVNNPPDDLEVECENDVPVVPQLDISDNCDLNPNVIFTERKDVIDLCTKKITREWIIQDACGNSTNENQIIDIIDRSQPEFIKFPENKFTNCKKDIVKEFNDWIKKNGNAIATDACGVVSWRTVYSAIPNKYCDSLKVDFISIDHCGHENVESAYFIIRDSSLPQFIVKPQNKNFTFNPNIKDSLRSWLNLNGFSIASTSCDTIIQYSNFDGDSTNNPIKVTFYIKDRCGNIDSASASFSYQSSSGTCCCGVATELSFPNLDFEAPPAAPPTLWIDYFAGDNYGGWNINSGSISIHDPGHLNLGAGNPNGSTQHMDLHGSTQGSATYTLTGLTAGYRYTISFWYAIHSGGGSNVTATLQVNGGSLLNVNWSASNPGNVIWFQTMYDFIADGSVADMKFIGTGSVPCCGMLIDDIQIFECPGDSELPIVTNPPDDLEVECDKDVPLPPVLNITDNCDVNPKITLKEKKETFDPCTKKITRTWEIIDACGNVTMEDQIIDIIDKTPPVFTKSPEDKVVYCEQDVAKEFNDWIKKNGNAIALDNCSAVIWRTDYDHTPRKYCDTIITAFIAIDICGYESLVYANFIVKDTSAPRFTIQAQSKNLVCVPNSRDSLRVWLDSFGFSKTSMDCDTVIRSHDFNGDSTQNPIPVTFYAKDRCGNIDSSKATFSYRSASDTFRITNYSCSFTQNSIDTIPYMSNGCDSIVILERIKILSDSIYIKLNTCNPQQKLFDTLKFVNLASCDSLVFLEYTLQPIPVTGVQIMDCTYLNYSKDTLILTGQFCDSIVIREYIPLRKDSITIQMNTCDKTKEDTLILNLKNSLGCDSIVTVITIYTGVLNTFLTSMECGLLKNYTDTIIKSNGNCDSLIITMHIGLGMDTVLIQNYTCDKTKVGTFSMILKNQKGCDSLVVETVTLDPSDSILISQSTCIFSQAGVNLQVFKNRFGCDSFITTVTRFIPSDTSIITQTTCDISNIGIDTLVKPGQPCDSVVFINTIFVPSDTITISKTSCDLLEVGSDTLIVSGPICDSVFIINTAFLQSDTVAISQKSCNPQDAGFKTYYYKNTAGCDSLVHVQTNYVPLQLNYELDSISCYNLNGGKFKVLNTSDFSNAFELIVNNNKLGNQTQLNNLQPGNYEIFIQDKNGCVTDSIYFSLTNPSDFIIDLGNDYHVNKGTIIQLNLQSNKTLSTIFWSPSSITNCTNCVQVQYTAEQEGWIYALAIDERGCESVDSIFIRLKQAVKIFAPNAISTNGDNLNDYFYLIGDDNIIIELLEIYDRWGERVFTTTNISPNKPESGWNGIFNNQRMNPGVFVYYAKVKFPSGETEVMKGDFTLIR